MTAWSSTDDPHRGLFWLTALLLAFDAVLWVGAWRIGWFVDGFGHARPVDFVNVWAAGHMALTGDAGGVWEWSRHRAAEILAIGRDFSGYYGWHYPPFLLLAAAPLALLGYGWAWVVWMAVTLPLYLVTLAGVWPRRDVVLAAVVLPATSYCLAVGQNGFLTAALLGGGLALLPRRPIVAGLVLGLLTYKPHFAVVVPLALVMARQWRPLAAAVGSCLALAGAVTLVFGVSVWTGFVGSLGITVHKVLLTGGSGWDKLQSVYALAHVLGAGEGIAWGLQVVMAVLLVAATAWAWQCGGRPGPRSALLIAATLAATPYLYAYDLPVVAVAALFLLRDGCDRGDCFAGETSLIALAVVLPTLAPLAGVVVAPATCLMLAGLALRRLWTSKPGCG